MRNCTDRREAVLEPRVDPGDPGGVALTIPNLSSDWEIRESTSSQLSRLRYGSEIILLIFSITESSCSTSLSMATSSVTSGLRHAAKVV